MELQENAGNVTVTFPYEVFWIEKRMARHWEREKVYVQAFWITSQIKITLVGKCGY
jgi:hypothetical protein